MDTITLDSFDPTAGYARHDIDSSTNLLDYAPNAAQGGRCPLGFGLFILLNAVMFIRPAEIVEDLGGLPIYEFIIVVCLLASWPVVLPQLAWSSLRRNPITLCVLGMLPAIILSHLSHYTAASVFYARVGATEFSKAVIYYLLLVGLVDSPRRMRLFLSVTTVFVVVTAILILLNHYGVISIPSLSDLKYVGYNSDPNDEQSVTLVRIKGMGIFSDPNDLCLILNAAAFVCLHRLLETKDFVRKFFLAFPIGLLLFGVALTQSRGGFLGMLAGLLVLLFSRFPRKRALKICLVILPVVFVLFAGRSTNIDVDNSNDTAQGRIHLWRDAMVVFHQHPIFGVGQGKLPEEIGLVAHNSYVHGYAELGFFGGTIFVGAFYLCVIGLRRLSSAKAPMLGPDLVLLRLCLLPVLAEYMMGIYSLSRNYVNTTYFILGIVAAFLVMARGDGADVPTVNKRLVRNVLLASVGCVFFFEVFVRTMAR